MFTKKCQFCGSPFEVKHASSKRKNCDEHAGLFKKNHKVEDGVVKRKCCKCKQFKDTSDFYKKQGKQEGSSWCLSCFNNNSYTSQKSKAIERKIKFVKAKGGKCSKCGYNKNLGSLVFHHVDPKQKSFSLNTRRISNTSMELLLLELDKCKLLCHNCHSEEHYPYLSDLL